MLSGLKHIKHFISLCYDFPSVGPFHPYQTGQKKKKKLGYSKCGVMLSFHTKKLSICSIKTWILCTSCCVHEEPPALQPLAPIFVFSLTPSSQIILILLQEMLNDFSHPKLIHSGNHSIISLRLREYKNYDDP